MNMKQRIVSGLLALGLLVALTGCGGGSGGVTEGDVTINMKSMAFEKRSVEIKAGRTVTWVNLDQTPHSVAEGTPDKGHTLFASEDYGYGESFSYTFAQPGTYEITCPTDGHWMLGMKMKVIVK